MKLRLEALAGTEREGLESGKWVSAVATLENSEEETHSMAEMMP